MWKQTRHDTNKSKSARYTSTNPVKSGKLYGYGNSSSNQVHQGMYIEDDAPIQLHKDIEWKDVHAGLEHTMALDVNNRVYLWGTICQGGNEQSGRLPFHRVDIGAINVRSIFSGFSSFGILEVCRSFSEYIYLFEG